MLRVVTFLRFSSFVKKMGQNLSKESERAQRVQYNALHEMYSIEHQAKLRQKVDLQTSIESLQKEMQRQIAQALKRSQSKVKYFHELAHKKYSQHKRHALQKTQISQYNKLVKSLETARWEYIVHRHSCGFTIRNYEIVTEMFRLPPYLTEQKNITHKK